MSLRSLLPVVIIMLVSNLPARGERVIPSYAFGMAYNFKFADALVSTSPDWLPQAEHPPLSARKAIALSDEFVTKLVTVPEDHDLRRDLIEASIVPYGSVFPQKWYWIVRYEWRLRVGGGTGIQPYVDVVVLMDGSVVTPEIKRRGDP